MNEQLQQAITKMIEKALSGLDAGAEFLAGEIPDVVMQLMLWHGIYNLLMAGFGVIFLALWVAIEIKIYISIWLRMKLTTTIGSFHCLWAQYLGV